MVEITTPHTGLLRMGVMPTASVTFWSRATEDQSTAELSQRAQDENWFEAASPARVSYIVGQLQKRFPYPARQLLEFRPRSDAQNLLICHWHLQLSDPLYRSYTSQFLLERWSSPTTSVDLRSTITWVQRCELTQHWQEATVKKLASALLSAAAEVGLCTGAGPAERDLKIPTVSTDDIEYLKALLDLAGASEKLDGYLISVGQSLSLPEAGLS